MSFKLNILYSLFLIGVIFYSCANPLPPTGGEEDKTPPSIVNSYPLPNTLNFRDNKIIIEFDDYVDRRSFVESFLLIPYPEKDLEFDWSGNEITVTVPSGLKENTTYSVFIGKDLKDIYGNQLTEPIHFAFSTGNKIDNCSIEGRIFSKRPNSVFVGAYKLQSEFDTIANPEFNKPLYITQLNEVGNYVFYNLPVGKFRLFAIEDLNHNYLYDRGIDNIAMLPMDLQTEDSVTLKSVNFIFLDYFPDQNYFQSEKFLNSFYTDSVGLISLSIKGGAEIQTNEKIFLKLNNIKLNRGVIADNLALFDSTVGERIVFALNWYSDSLVEILPVVKFKYSSVVKLVLDLSSFKSAYKFESTFKIADEKKFATISGTVINQVETGYPVIISLYSKNKDSRRYRYFMTKDTTFNFTDVYEDEYLLFAFIDRNGNEQYDAGNPYPYKPSEYFFIIDKGLNVRGNLTLRDLKILF